MSASSSNYSTGGSPGSTGLTFPDISGLMPAPAPVIATGAGSSTAVGSLPWYAWAALAAAGLALVVIIARK